MIFEKRGMWKSSHSAKKFASKFEAEKWEAENVSPAEPKIIVEKEDTSDWTPLEKLRGKKELCLECNCDPCECEEEWNSVEETLSETESSTEEPS